MVTLVNVRAFELIDHSLGLFRETTIPCRRACRITQLVMRILHKICMINIVKQFSRKQNIKITYAWKSFMQGYVEIMGFLQSFIFDKFINNFKRMVDIVWVAAGDCYKI